MLVMRRFLTSKYLALSVFVATVLMPLPANSASIQGVVMWMTGPLRGLPAAGVQLDICINRDVNWCMSAYAGSSGSYFLDNVPEGIHDIYVTADGRKRLASSVQVTSQGPNVFRIELAN